MLIPAGCAMLRKLNSASFFLFFDTYTPSSFLLLAPASRLCRNSEMLQQNPMKPRSSSPFCKGGSRGILKRQMVSENQNPPCPPLGKGGIQVILRLRHSLSLSPFRRRGIREILRLRHSLFPQSTQVKAVAAALQTGQVPGNPSALVYPQTEQT